MTFQNETVAFDHVRLNIHKVITKRTESKLRRFELILTPLTSGEKKITAEMLIYGVKGVKR